MDVELQQVEERVIYEVECTIDVLLDAEQELERSTGLIACCEWNVLKCAGSVCYMFASVSVVVLSTLRFKDRILLDLHCPIETAYRNWLPDFISWLDERFLQ